MPNTWKCPSCGRAFTRANQRHACGTGDRREPLRGRPESLVRLYEAIESFTRALGPVEIVARERYILLRSVRIFADLVVMSDALRIAIHLPRQVDHALFFKVVADKRAVTHVAKLRTQKEWLSLRSFVKEAYDWSLPAPK